jgi:hypothetical protein
MARLAEGIHPLVSLTTLQESRSQYSGSLATTATSIACAAKENQLGRVTEDVKDAGQRKDSVEIEKQSGQRNEKYR